VTARWGDAASAWPWLGWLVAPALLLLLLPRPATARLWPVRALPEAYRNSAAAVLAAGLWLWTLVANVTSDGSAAPLPHVPLLNPLDLGVGLAIATTLLWLKSTQRIANWSLAMAAAAAFVWLNAMLVRGFHHYGGVPYRFDAWLGSLAVQTGITLLWTAIALVAMWLGAARAARLPWVAGAALLAAVVLKLLVVDLSGSGSVTRIVSFIGVGVLMLVIGYVAPLPAKESRHAVV
jgi:Predicted membrane protein